MLSASKKSMVNRIILGAVIIGVGWAVGYFAVQSQTPEALADDERETLEVIPMIVDFTQPVQVIRTELVTNTVQLPDSALKKVEFSSGFELFENNILNDTNNSVVSGKNLQLVVLQSQPICAEMVNNGTHFILLKQSMLLNSFNYIEEPNPDCDGDTFIYELIGWSVLEEEKTDEP